MQSHTTELLTLRQPHIPIKNHQTLRIGMSWPRKVILEQLAQLEALDQLALREVTEQLDQLDPPEVTGLLAQLEQLALRGLTGQTVRRQALELQPQAQDQLVSRQVDPIRRKCLHSAYLPEILDRLDPLVLLAQLALLERMEATARMVLLVLLERLGLLDRLDRLDRKDQLVRLILLVMSLLLRQLTNRFSFMIRLHHNGLTTTMTRCIFV